MDVTIAALYFAISLGAVLLAYLVKEDYLAAIAAIAFILLGLQIMTTGIDTQILNTQTRSLNSTDLYSYSWNATFNQSTVANITTNLNQTLSASYTYANSQNTYTVVFAFVLVGIGALVGFRAMLPRRTAKEGEAE